MIRFARHIRGPFEKWIKPRFTGLPFRYLEIGVFEGACLNWMFENVLTNPECIVDAVDPWQGYTAEPDRHGNERVYTQEQMDGCYNNVVKMASKQQSHWTIHRMTHAEFLSSCKTRYDLIFLDGEHSCDATKGAASTAAVHLLPNGLIVFDDYNISDVSRAVDEWLESLERPVTEYYRTRHQRCFQLW